MKRFLYKPVFALMFLTLTGTFAVSAQNGFTLEQSVIATGGGKAVDATNNTFSVTSTIGQPIAGSAAGNPPFTIESGFIYEPAVPATASTVTASGRVLTAAGKGILKIKVTLTDAKGVSRSVSTGRGGNYIFTDVMAGETYIFSVSGRKYTFSVPVIVRVVNEQLTDLNFIANPLDGTR